MSAKLLSYLQILIYMFRNQTLKNDQNAIVGDYSDDRKTVITYFS